MCVLPVKPEIQVFREMPRQSEKYLKFKVLFKFPGRFYVFSELPRYFRKFPRHIAKRRSRFRQIRKFIEIYITYKYFLLVICYSTSNYCDTSNYKAGPFFA